MIDNNEDVLSKKDLQVENKGVTVKVPL